MATDHYHHLLFFALFYLFMALLQSRRGSHLFQTHPHLTALLSAVAAAVSLVACGLCNWGCTAVCGQMRKNNKEV